MKYEFKTIDLDTYQLIYTNKDGKKITKEFKRTIEMAEKLDGIVEEARFKLAEMLSKRGKTKDDFVIKRDDGKGHVTYDETNYIQLEQGVINDTTGIVVNNIIKECFGMSLIELMADMGVDINDNSPEIQKEAELFGNKFGMIISGGTDKKTPSDGKGSKQ